MSGGVASDEIRDVRQCHSRLDKTGQAVPDKCNVYNVHLSQTCVGGEGKIFRASHHTESVIIELTYTASVFTFNLRIT